MRRLRLGHLLRLRTRQRLRWGSARPKSFMKSPSKPGAVRATMNQRIEGPKKGLNRPRVGAAALLAPGRGAAGRPTAGPGRLRVGIHGTAAEGGTNERTNERTTTAADTARA